MLTGVVAHHNDANVNGDDDTATMHAATVVHLQPMASVIVDAGGAGTRFARPTTATNTSGWVRSELPERSVRAVAELDILEPPVAPFRRLIHFLMSLAFPWCVKPQRGHYADGTVRPLLDYWVWDHFIIPFTLYMYFRSWVMAWLIDLLWEVVERGIFFVIGWWNGWSVDRPEEWPDTFKPETWFNSWYIDPLTGLAGILLCKLAVDAFDLPPLFPGGPIALVWPCWQMVVQLLIIALVGMASGTGFWQLYFFAALEAGTVVLIQVFWNDIATKTLWVWLGVMAASVAGVSLARFVPRQCGPWLQNPLFTLAIGIVPLYIAFGVVAIVN